MRSLLRIALIVLFALGVDLFVTDELRAADPYPQKAVRLVVPFPAGGSTDVIGRVLAQKLSASMGQPVVVDNRPGAGSQIGSDLVAKAAPDGYTILLGTTGMAVQFALDPKMPFDPLKDLAHVALVAETANVLLVHPSVPAKNVAELVTYLKSRPTTHFAGSGVGTGLHLAGEMFKSLAGVNIVHVPYRGSGPAMTAALGGEVSMIFDNLTTALPHVRGGKLRALAVTTSKRSPLLPDVPTFAEAGYPKMEMSVWYGIMAPRGTAPAIVQTLHTHINKILTMPEVEQRLGDLATSTAPKSIEAFTEYVKADIERWREAGRLSGTKLN